MNTVRDVIKLGMKGGGRKKIRRNSGFNVRRVGRGGGGRLT